MAGSSQERHQETPAPQKQEEAGLPPNTDKVGGKGLTLGKRQKELATSGKQFGKRLKGEKKCDEIPIMSSHRRRPQKLQTMALLDIRDPSIYFLSFIISMKSA
ncbi:hypothetical protein L5515_008429 [Caenorhabditis briggsae]|uniref:Uncharacterized protein n=1 Tax=Caenorhabditis briggsae TaxID=6238 RepID=A0AAE9F133_CAEBR|nr:hypothetical protein L5515_008429 [Caenorhabditis briggsae]